MNKTFVGFGFGPIQSALFLFEAYRSKNFSRFVVAEIDQDLVRAIRANGGRYTINIARKDRIDQFELKGIELYNPREAKDRQAIIEAISTSDEMATGLPSVNIYPLGDQASVVSLIGEGLGRAIPRVIYAAENHNHAAEILLEHLTKRVPAAKLAGVQILNTVIGKMSGVITDEDEIRRLGLTTITPGIGRAVLVEEFNRILISKIDLAGYRRGIEVFIEKEDLLPFEEAKLYGHNAIHALLAYLADSKGMTTVAQAGKDREIMTIARKAFIDESGAALIRRHQNLHDALFTAQGYQAYADDLLERMVNPNLNDLVSRVGRDHVRKLGYEDRLYGTMNLALHYGVEPKNLALGAAAGILSMIKRQGSFEKPVPHLPRNEGELSEPILRELLGGLWASKVDQQGERLISLTWDALESLRHI